MAVKKSVPFTTDSAIVVMEKLDRLMADLNRQPNVALPHIASSDLAEAVNLITDAVETVRLLEAALVEAKRRPDLAAMPTHEIDVTRSFGGEEYAQMIKDLQTLVNEEALRKSPHANLLANVFNNIVAQLRVITHNEHQIEELRNMAVQREEELARVRGELHVALGGEATQKENDGTEPEGDLPSDFFFGSIFKEKGTFLAANNKEQFLSGLQDTAMTLNSMSVEGMPHERRKALTDAFGLIQSIATDNKIVYLLDWRRQVPSPEKYREMLKALELLIVETNNPSWKYKELSVTIFNTLVAQKKTIDEQEQKLKEAHIELDHLKKTVQVAEEEDTSPPALLAPEQRGADNGFWVISREWHDYAMGSHDIDLNQRSGREKYLIMLRHDVAKLAAIANPEGIESVAVMMVMVEWDSHMLAEEKGDNRYGPVFSSGTLKLLPEQNKPAEPVKPVEPPCAVPDKFDASGLYLLNEDWRRWFMIEHPSYANLDRITNRNYMRSVLSISVGRMLKVTGKSPVIVVDWDAAASIGGTYFSVPEHDPKAFKMALNNL